MKTSKMKSIVFLLVLLTGLILISANVSAQALPYLGNGGSGNYTYNHSTGSLTFTGNFADYVVYTNGAGYDDLPPYTDDIYYMSEFIFGSLTNSPGDPTNFGSSTLTVRDRYVPTDVYFTATIDNFDAINSTWLSLSNVTAGNLNSRYVDELLAIGQGSGNLFINTLTPTGGGTENFIGNSGGSSSFIIAAPEPISTVLFITGGATLALGRFRRKKF